PGFSSRGLAKGTGPLPRCRAARTGGSRCRWEPAGVLNPLGSTDLTLVWGDAGIRCGCPRALMAEHRLNVGEVHPFSPERCRIEWRNPDGGQRCTTPLLSGLVVQAHLWRCCLLERAIRFFCSIGRRFRVTRL